MTGTTNLETVQLVRADRRLQDMLGEVRYAPPGSHEEAMSTAMEAQRA